MEIETRQIASLVPYDNNPRINDGAVTAVMRSLKEFGWRQPVVIDEAGNVVCGHTRIKAAKKLGWTEVPCHVARDLTPEQIRAYRIADNKTAEIAEWEVERLSAELSELADAGANMNALGFSEEELEAAMSQFNVGEAGMPDLPSGDRDPIQQMTFTLTDEQAADVKSAMESAKGEGPFIDTGNENSNGNALARIVEAYLGQG